ncbi:MAG TPA: hypothetical protein ENG03_07480 [Thioploca sp.]|nr:MAG: hypothetical protein B6247_12730 [Beggiatoa sp. 4572_84]RKZ62161.1 MAG: hypothetical protein DRR08_06775 [Gammaproteobacteria bacterium]HDN26922.1 hypothetical protein [Thioploca sp.]
MEKSSKAEAVIQTAFFGLVSATLYFLLYYFELPILNWSKQGGWYIIVLVAIALIFYFVHGAFISHFWDVLGLKAKSVKK